MKKIKKGVESDCDEYGLMNGVETKRWWDVLIKKLRVMAYGGAGIIVKGC